MPERESDSELVVDLRVLEDFKILFFKRHFDPPVRGWHSDPEVKRPMFFGLNLPGAPETRNSLKPILTFHYFVASACLLQGSSFLSNFSLFPNFSLGCFPVPGWSRDPRTTATCVSSAKGPICPSFGIAAPGQRSPGEQSPAGRGPESV